MQSCFRLIRKQVPGSLEPRKKAAVQLRKLKKQLLHIRHNEQRFKRFVEPVQHNTIREEIQTKHGRHVREGPSRFREMMEPLVHQQGDGGRSVKTPMRRKLNCEHLESHANIKAWDSFIKKYRRKLKKPKKSKIQLGRWVTD